MKGFYPTTLSFAKPFSFIYLNSFIPTSERIHSKSCLFYNRTHGFLIRHGVFFSYFLIVWLKKRWASMSFLILFYLVTLLPLSNFIRISAPWDMGFFVTAERFFIYPSLGFCGIISVLLTTVPGKTCKRSFPDIGICYYFTVHCAFNLLFRSNAFKKSGLD